MKYAGILLADGFSELQTGVRYWNCDISSDSKIPFLKLHGSVDWFRYRPDNSEPWYDDRIGIPLNGDLDHTETEDGTLQMALDNRPLLLIGTFNKISDYSRGIFLDLRYGFRSTLSKADQLVVCGYGFGDKGINSEIIRWYYETRGRRLLVIDPNCDEIISNARGAIRSKWNDWKKNGSIALITKRLEEVGIGEFLEAIGHPGSTASR